MRTKQIALGCAAAMVGLALAPATAAADPWWRRIYLRGLGVAYVDPLSQSREMELANIEGPASLAVSNGPIPGSGASINAATIPAVNIGYRLPVLNDQLSLEIIAGTPFTVKFRATGTLANESIAPMALGIPTGVPALGPDLGEAQALPIVITAPYRFLPDGMVQPYVGAGAAVLFAQKEKITNPILTEVRMPDFSIAPAPGFVLQGGVDVKLWRQVYARLDVKFIAGMLARAEVSHIFVRTPDLPLFDTVEVGTAKMSVWVNPLIVQAGVGFDFTMF